MLGLAGIAAAGCAPGGPRDQSAISYLGEVTGQSQLTTWTCTGSPCPWGEETSNHALAWPAEGQPITARLGYTTSPAVYLPSAQANGLTIKIVSGTASLYAGDPFWTSHDFISTLSDGDSLTVANLDPEEVLSVQGGEEPFTYRITPADPNAPDAGVTDAGDDDPGPDAGPRPDAGPPPDVDSIASQLVTWTCIGIPCPWGDPVSGHAVVWPADSRAVTPRMGYSASAGIYLPGYRANGATIWATSGEMIAYAGLPGDTSHRVLGSIEEGEALVIGGLASREVVSVESEEPFSYKVKLPPPGAPDAEGPPGALFGSQLAYWRCNLPNCDAPDWTGAIITWPSWAAYQNNARDGINSRSVFSASDQPLYTYMGPWAQGCEVTAESGTVLIIEWQRGTNAWRETWLYPRQSHTINLVPPENGAMIETYDGSPGFSVSLKNCTPQPIGPDP
jgi:hypothetical protein